MNDASHPSKPAFPQPVSGTVVPRFGDVATFMRLPLFRDPADVEIGMVGVPWDGGTTNRPGARHGPRQMRDLSTMMRRVHHVTGVAPYELAKCGDLLQQRLLRCGQTKVHAIASLEASNGHLHLFTFQTRRKSQEHHHSLCLARRIHGRRFKVPARYRPDQAHIGVVDHFVKVHSYGVKLTGFQIDGLITVVALVCVVAARQLLAVEVDLESVHAHAAQPVFACHFGRQEPSPCAKKRRLAVPSVAGFRGCAQSWSCGNADTAKGL